MPAGVIGDIMALTGDRDSSLVQGFFETKDFKKLMQLTEVDPEVMFPLIVMDTIRRRYPKARILKDVMESHFLLHVSKDRKGRDEYAEVALASRRSASGMEDE